MQKDGNLKASLPINVLQPPPKKKVYPKKQYKYQIIENYPNPSLKHCFQTDLLFLDVLTQQYLTVQRMILRRIDVCYVKICKSMQLLVQLAEVYSLDSVAIKT